MRLSAKTWAGLNLAGFLATLTLNGLANGLPLFGRQTGDISDSLPNLFVPAGLTFAVWGPIYLGLLVFTVYQTVLAFRAKDPGPAWLAAIAPWVFVSHLANGLWIVAWHGLQFTLSLVLMLVLFGALVKIVLTLGWSKTRFGPAVYGLAAVPWSLYLGWITVALPANVTGLLVASGIGVLAPGEVFWAAALAAVAAGLGLTAAWRYRDPVYPLVISWALGGIALKRADDQAWLAGWAAALALVLLGTALSAALRRGYSPAKTA